MGVDPAGTKDDEIQTAIRSLPKDHCLKKVPKFVKNRRYPGRLSWKSLCKTTWQKEGL